MKSDPPWSWASSPVECMHVCTTMIVDSMTPVWLEYNTSFSLGWTQMKGISPHNMWRTCTKKNKLKLSTQKTQLFQAGDFLAALYVNNGQYAFTLLPEEWKSKLQFSL